jgi:hypothetical protein
LIIKLGTVLHAFVNEVFNGEIKDHIEYESIPAFFIREQFDLVDKYLKENNSEKAVSHLKALSSMREQKDEVKFYFKFKDKKYFINSQHNMINSYFSFFEAELESTRFSSDTKIASFGVDTIPIITENFISFIDNFESFKENIIEDIEYINNNSFILLEDYKSKVKNCFSVWNDILKQNNYNEKHLCIYNDHDNKSYFKNFPNYEMIYHEDQDTVFIHILDKTNENYKIFNCSHINNITFNKNLETITPDYFSDNFTTVDSFLLFDSFKGLNVKCKYANRLKENLLTLSIAFNEVR